LSANKKSYTLTLNIGGIDNDSKTIRRKSSN